MPCTICHENGHNSTTCSDPIIGQTVGMIFEKLMYNISRLDGYDNLRPFEVSPQFKLSFNGNHSLEDCVNIMRSRRALQLDHVRDNCISTIRNTVRAVISLPLLKKTKDIVLDRLKEVRESSVDNVLNDLRYEDFMGFRIKNDYYQFYGILSFKLAEYNLPANYLVLEGYTRSQFRSFQNILNEFPESIRSAALRAIPNQDDLYYLFEGLHLHQRRLIRHTHNRARRDNTVHINSKPKFTIKMISPDSDIFTSQDCPICMDSLSDKDTISLSCKHSFCGNCITELISRKCNNCPACRADMNEFHFKSNISPENFNNLFAKLT